MTFLFFTCNFVTCYYLLFPSLAGQPEVKFIASRLDSPDLPTWLHLEQRQPTDRAFIYGTPGPDVSSQVVLEVSTVLIKMPKLLF